MLIQESLSPNEVIEYPVSQKQLAEKFGVNKRLLQDLRKQNKIPFIEAGRRILYQPSQVIQALKVEPQNFHTCK